MAIQGPVLVPARCVGDIGPGQGDLYAKLIEMIPLGRDGKVDDLVGIALLLASDAGSFITGDIIHVNGGMWVH